MTLAVDDVDSKPLEVVVVAEVYAEERVEESLVERYFGLFWLFWQIYALFGALFKGLNSAVVPKI